MDFWHIDWYGRIVTYYSEKQNMDGHESKMLALNDQFMKKFDLKVVVSVWSAPTSDLNRLKFGVLSVMGITIICEASEFLLI